MSLLPVNVLKYIVDETSRQLSDNVVPMRDAYRRIYVMEGPLSELKILALANCFGWTNYRFTPVAFLDGVPAMHSSGVPDAMERLISLTPDKQDFSSWFNWTKMFLDIHPFEDGNGRMASLIFNWGMCTLDTPIPLPYYKF